MLESGQSLISTILSSLKHLELDPSGIPARMWCKHRLDQKSCAKLACVSVESLDAASTRRLGIAHPAYMITQRTGRNGRVFVVHARTYRNKDGVLVRYPDIDSLTSLHECTTPFPPKVHVPDEDGMVPRLRDLTGDSGRFGRHPAADI